MWIAAGLWVGCYLVGAIPFGYLVARMRGVDLFAAGSGNIGATNVGRVLGRKFGVLVFLLDFAKGAVPVGVVEPLAQLIDPTLSASLGLPDVLPVGAAAAAFVGHLFPVYLRFRGGKGVATGFGAVCVLVPGPAGVAILVWAVVVLASRYVSLASVVAAAVLAGVRLLVPDPFGDAAVVVTTFCVAATLLVVAKHRANVRRLVAGTENRIGDSPVRHHLLKAIHLLAVGFWFGGAGFFNFVAAPTIFESFKEVVRTAPSDRTAGVAIVPVGTSEEGKAGLASALAGSAVGPIFPKYFAVQAACGAVALVTAVPWRRLPYGRLRVFLLAFGLLGVLVGKPLSEEVSRVRIERFDSDSTKAATAKERFGPVHLVSLALSGATTLLAGAGLALASRLPENSSVEL